MGRYNDLLPQNVSVNDFLIIHCFLKNSHVVNDSNDAASYKACEHGLTPFHLNIFLVFLPEELRQSLMPTLEKLYRQEPESLPFRQPVDPKLLGCLVSSAKY